MTHSSSSQATIHGVILDVCQRTPNRAALRQKVGGGWHTTTYAELRRTVHDVASGLIAEGFMPGDHAAIIAPSSPRWVMSYLGILGAAGIVIPVDKELRAQELRHILADSLASVAFVGADHLEVIEEIAPSLPALRRIVLMDSQAPGADDVVPTNIARALNHEAESLAAEFSIPADKLKRFQDLSRQLLATLTTQEPASRENRYLEFGDLLTRQPRALPHRHRNDTAAIIYTSGTTGRSKGAMLSHGNITSNILGAARHFGIDETIHTLSFLPINHVFEQVVGILLPLSVGGTVSFAESIKKLGDNLAEVKPTFLLGVPAVYRLLHDRMKKTIESRALSRLLFNLPVARIIVRAKVRRAFGGNITLISGGAALDPAVADGLQAMGLDIYQGYGITETSPIITAEAPNRKRLGSVGFAMEGIELQVDSPNEEGVGELLVQGPNVMQGYYNNAAATEDVLQEGWYRTGDLARIDGEGFVWICGRVKNLIVTANGKNVYPEEIELALLQSPFIAEVMVYGHKVDGISEEVHAIIFPNQQQLDDHAASLDKGPLNEKDVEDLIRREVLAVSKGLADYKRVRKFTIRDEELPKTTTRKIKRFEVEASISTRH